MSPMVVLPSRYSSQLSLYRYARRLSIRATASVYSVISVATSFLPQRAQRFDLCHQADNKCLFNVILLYIQCNNINSGTLTVFTND